MCDLRTLGVEGKIAVDLDDSHLSAIKLLKERMTSGKPRKLTAKPQSKPWIPFTDGMVPWNTTVMMSRKQAWEPSSFPLKGMFGILDAECHRKPWTRGRQMDVNMS